MRLTLFVAVAFTALSLSGCAASVKTQGQTQYRADTFSRSTLEAGGLAILPVSAGQGQEGYRRPFGDAINRSVDSLAGPIRVHSWQQTMQEVNDAGLTQDYQAAISAYQSTSIIDRDIMQRISEATGTRFFLYTLLGSFEADSRARVGIGNNVYTEESMGVNAFAQVWDAQSADVVWEGRASSAATSGQYTYLKDASAESFSALVAQELASELLNN